MIKINIDGDRMKEIKEKHLLYANQYIKIKLEQKRDEVPKEGGQCEYNFYDKLYKIFEDIIIGEPSILNNLVKLDENNSEKTLYNLYDEALNEVYLKYSSKDKSEEFIKKLNVECSKQDKKLEKFHNKIQETYKKDANSKNEIKQICNEYFNEEIKNIFKYSSFGENKEVYRACSIYVYINDLNRQIRKKETIKSKIGELIKKIEYEENATSDDVLQAKLEKFKKNIKENYIDIENINLREKLLYECKILKYCEWGAYPLLKELNVNVCPYCNRQYISIDESNELSDKNKDNVEGRGKTRPELDHFLCQKHFPFFSMSLYNLIPSCHVCNSNLKSSEKFVKTKKEERCEEALNPHDAGFNENYVFSINPSCNQVNNYDFLFKNSLEFNIGFKERIIEKVYPESIQSQLQLIEKAKVNEKTFHLDTLYNNNHKDIVYELIQIAKVYNEDYLDELINNYPTIFKCKKDIMRIVLSNYLDIEDFDKRPMAKLTRDIAEELGILKYIE